MMAERQAAYLEAMGIPVFVPKDAVAETEVEAVVETEVEVAVETEAGPAEVTGLRLGPGSGRFLLLCAGVEETAGKLAADIARVFPEQPVWAWPAAEGSGRGVDEVVDEHLFTDMIVFGEAPAQVAFGGAAPGMTGSARVLLAPGMVELAADAAARKTLWLALCARGLVPGR